MAASGVTGSSERPSLRERIRLMWRVTAFRLTLIFMGVFLLFSVLLVTVSLVTVTGVLNREARNIINQEFVALQRAQARGGVRALASFVERRS